MVEPHDLIEIAKIIKPHGIRGELKVLAYTQRPEDLRKYERFFVISEGATREVRVERFKALPGGIVLKLEKVEQRDSAEEYRGVSLWIQKKQLKPLDEQEYYIRDLLGMEVKSLEGESLGFITDVLELSENDVYQVSGAGKELLIPAISEVVKKIDLQQRVVTVSLLPGLLEAM